MTMKRVLIIAFCCIAAFYGCKCSKKTPAEPQPQVQKETYLNAITKYMTGIGSQYLQGEYCIPYSLIVAADTTDSDDIKVWGDFWVENYNQVGDTLKSVSGGSHPGCMHLKKTDDGFSVTKFDAVGDGSDFNPTAKAIFGDLYDSFMGLTSNDDAKRTARVKSISEYAAANNLKVSFYQDYGWPAVKLGK